MGRKGVIKPTHSLQAGKIAKVKEGILKRLKEQVRCCSCRCVFSPPLVELTVSGSGRMEALPKQLKATFVSNHVSTKNLGGEMGPFLFLDFGASAHSDGAFVLPSGAASPPGPPRPVNAQSNKPP